MGLKDKLFKWFKVQDKKREEMSLGYVLEGEPKTNEDLQKVFKAFNIESKFNLFKTLTRAKIDFALIPSNEGEIKIGQSKIGGKPDLINGADWPTTKSDKYLSFIAQLNCAELSEFDRDNLLPSNGLISFFYCADQEAWGFDPKDLDKFKVIYTESNDNLERMDFPENLETHSTFRPNELKFDSSLSLPGWEHHSIEGLLSDEEADNAGMMWGDSGKLYYWIRKQDLQDKNFDKSWFVLQCY